MGHFKCFGYHAGCRLLLPLLFYSVRFRHFSFSRFLSLFPPDPPLSLSLSLSLTVLLSLSSPPSVPPHSSLVPISLPLLSPPSPSPPPLPIIPSLLFSQLATQIRDIQRGVRTVAHKILTACREFYMATFLFIFNYVSTSCGAVICVRSSVLIWVIRGNFLPLPFIPFLVISGGVHDKTYPAENIVQPFSTRAAFV